MSDTFLTESDIARITEIKRGGANKSREQLQCEALRNMGIPFTTSRLGRPLVVKDLYSMPSHQPTPPSWNSSVLL